MKYFVILILSIISLQSFSATPTYVKAADKPLYDQYLIYCNKMVLDTVMMVGYKTLPLVAVTYVNKYTYTNPDGTKVVRVPGTYLTQKNVLNSKSYGNQSRKRTYKNVNKIVNTVPGISATKALAWFPISYYCMQRKPSIRDFYEWYYLLKIKPTN
jgi:hypothetical protein